MPWCPGCEKDWTSTSFDSRIQATCDDCSDHAGTKQVHARAAKSVGDHLQRLTSAPKPEAAAKATKRAAGPYRCTSCSRVWPNSSWEIWPPNGLKFKECESCFVTNAWQKQILEWRKVEAEADRLQKEEEQRIAQELERKKRAEEALARHLAMAHPTYDYYRYSNSFGLGRRRRG